MKKTVSQKDKLWFFFINFEIEIETMRMWIRMHSAHKLFSKWHLTHNSNKSVTATFSYTLYRNAFRSKIWFSRRIAFKRFIPNHRQNDSLESVSMLQWAPHCWIWHDSFERQKKKMIRVFLNLKEKNIIFIEFTFDTFLKHIRLWKLWQIVDKWNLSNVNLRMRWLFM